MNFSGCGNRPKDWLHSFKQLNLMVIVCLLVSGGAKISAQPGQWIPRSMDTQPMSYTICWFSRTAKSWSTTTGLSTGSLVRLQTNGTPDASFHVDLPPAAEIDRVTLQPDGKLVIAGTFLSVEGISRPCLARLNTNGTLDASFVPQLIVTNPPPPPPPNPIQIVTNEIGQLWIQDNGDILVGGLKNILAADGSPLPPVVRLNAQGDLADSLDSMTNLFIPAARQADGKVLVARVLSRTYPGASTLIRFNTNGMPDSAFSPPDIQGLVNAVCVQNGKILLAGNMVRINGIRCGSVARLLENGALDIGFLSETYGGVSTMVPQSDGRVVIGGGFGFPNAPLHNLARLNADGSLDLTYATTGPGGNSSPYVYTSGSARRWKGAGGRRI